LLALPRLIQQRFIAWRKYDCMIKLRAVAAACLMLALTGPLSQGMAQECVTGRAGRQLLEQRQVVPFPDAARRAGIGRDRVLRGLQLCRSPGGYSYRGRAIDQRGRVRPFDLPAR
jgi:hypothetical protein